MGGLSVELNDVANTLIRESRDVYLRVLALRRGVRWVVHNCWALVGAEPPDWAETVWMYEDYAFVAVRTTAANLAVLCSSEACTSMTVGPLTVWAPGAASLVNKGRRPGYSLRDRPQLTFPVTEYTVAPTDRADRQLPHGMLVGDGDAPSFPEPNSAWRAFFEADFALAGARTPSSDLATVRVADQAAWIGSVHITPTELKVTVEGEDVQGVDLELYGEKGRTVQRVDAPGCIIISLPHGLPAHAWLWLKRGTTWLDYRSIDPSSAWTGDLQRADVEIDLPVDPVATVEALIASGEGPRLEFKQMLPTRDDRRTLKTVAAFANGDGGAIVFGIHRDEVTITGIAEDKSSTRMRDEFGNLVRATVQPTPEFEIKEYRLNGKLIFILEVQPGQRPPYGLVTPGARDKQPEYFVRRGSNTYGAQPDELRAIVLWKNGLQDGSVSWR
ncbi:ATP-binding protein [Streptomyces sp. NPDC002588]|uniref:AlbA family DNA-binding domain-containing protein n=1 Tax=Streptomyces sp. NPDC002588 TaxID=3154419 RepID=UPI003324F0AE